MTRKLNLRRVKNIEASSPNSQPPVTEEYVEFISNPRNGFCTTKGVIISCDLSGQELRTAAVVSKDPAMCNTFLAPSVIQREDGSSYENPYTDLHLLTCVNATHPELFAGLPEDQWLSKSKKIPPGQNKKPRDLAKTLNFAKALAK